MFERNDFNVQAHNRNPVMLVDEVSTIEYFIGTSWNRADQSKPTWRIQRIWKVGNVWHFGFPRHVEIGTGNQDFVWIWDSRYGYTYLP
jgi:hypothetical protein